MARPINPETGKKVPVVSMNGHDAMKLVLVLLALIPILFMLAIFVSPYLILVALFGFILYQAVRS